MSDPIFGRVYRKNHKHHKHHDQASPRSSKAASPKLVKRREIDLDSVAVENVRIGLEVMSMANALGHNSALFIYLDGCPYCEHFKAAWNKACDGKSAILWLHCVIPKMNDARMYLGAMSFPCLVANGRIHQEESDANTSEMTASEITVFASKRGDDGSTIDFVDEQERPHFSVDHQDLLSEHSDESSEGASEAVSSDRDSSDAGSCGGEEDAALEGLGSESIIDEDDIDQKDGFQYTALPTDIASASRSRPLMICYYWNQCGGCKRFQPEWNSLVQQAMDETPTVTFAVVNIEENQDMFQKTGSQTVPHIQLHAGHPAVHATGPRSAKQMWDWVRQKVL